MKWLSDADFGSRADGYFERAAGARFELYGEEAKEAGHVMPRIACSHGAWPSAAVRFIQLFIAIGTTTASCPSNLPKRCKETDQASPASSPI